MKDGFGKRNNLKKIRGDFFSGKSPKTPKLFFFFSFTNKAKDFKKRHIVGRVKESGKKEGERKREKKKIKKRKKRGSKLADFDA